MATQTPASTAAAAVPAAQDILPRPEPPFKGVIGLKAKESRPDFPKAITAPPGGSECPSDPDRRHGLWGIQHLRRTDPDAHS